jgi:predicted nucleotidyltransferase
MERLKYFENFRKIGKEIKEIVSKHVKAKVFIFGSVVRNEYTVGLSDIDVAIVSDEFNNRERKLKVYDILFSKYFDSPLEFHLLTQKQWEFFLRFVGKDFIEIS